MNYIALFFAGAFLCNSIPHIASGVQGLPFPSPFAKPRGIGMSSPLINFYWGAFNFLAGLALLVANPVAIGLNLPFATVIVGALAIGTQLSIHFGKVQRS